LVSRDYLSGQNEDIVPIYEYVCQSCAHRFEVKQKLSDAPVERCVRCGEPVQKVISAPAIMFKGTGWYVTDYSDKLKAPGDGAASNGQGDVKAGTGTDGKEQKPQKDQKAPATGGSPDTSSASPSKDAATPAAPSGSGSGSASGSGTPTKPTGSSS
jgi:putative FmdB family regulatory protein